MTDSRFCRKLIEEIQKNIIKTQQSLDLKDWERLGEIYIPYPAKAYTRITNLLNQINSMCTEYQIQLTNDIAREIYVKFK